MKIILSMLITLYLIMVLVGCNEHRFYYNVSLPRYLKEESYEDSEFKDFVNYSKYYYDEQGMEEFKKSKDFRRVTEKDIKDIKIYLEHFSSWAAIESFSEQYDFDYQTQLSTEDLWCSRSEDGPDDEYLNRYTIYYLDVSKKILYFFNLKI